jgi:hypothetical protein
LVRPDNIARKITVEIIMTIIRAITVLMALHTTTGTSKSKVISDRNSIRAIRFITEPENIYTFGSLEALLKGFCYDD